MYNLLIALGAALAVFAAFFFADLLPWYLALPFALTVFAACFILLTRWIMKKLHATMDAVNKDLQGQRIEKAIRTLQSALALGPWQFSIKGQIHSQIGMIYYMKRDFSQAFPHLQKSFVKNWIAMGMLAICYSKRQKKNLMVSTFEKALQWSPKESLLWQLYAYCLHENGDGAAAVKVLERGLKKLPGDERISGNLTLLRDGKKMKMRSYGDLWLQFHLERQSVVLKQQAAALGGTARRKIIRK